MTTVKCPASQLQCGDQILVSGAVKTVVAIEALTVLELMMYLFKMTMDKSFKK